MRWQDRNWRGWASALDIYRARGEYIFQQLVRYLMGMSGVKFLIWEQMPIWMILVGLPFWAAFCIGAGYFVIHYGWDRQSSEVAVLEDITPLNRASYWWAARAAAALGYKLNDIPPGLPDEVCEIMSSAKHPRASERNG